MIFEKVMSISPKISPDPEENEPKAEVLNLFSEFYQMLAKKTPKDVRWVIR